MASQDSEIDSLVRRAAEGDQEAFCTLVECHRSRLRRMVVIRMDPLLHARLDASDVVQEVFIEAARRIASYAQYPKLPFYPWLRGIAWRQLVDLHRRHVKVAKRNVRREERQDLPLSQASMRILANRLSARGTSPSGRLERDELREHVRVALDGLEPEYREVLVLRHLEQLSVAEVAAVLGIEEGAVKMRRLRAARRLRQLLDDLAT